jgi:hypothetical protein
LYRYHFVVGLNNDSIEPVSNSRFFTIVIAKYFHIIAYLKMAAFTAWLGLGFTHSVFLFLSSFVFKEDGLKLIPVHLLTNHSFKSFPNPLKRHPGHDWGEKSIYH